LASLTLCHFGVKARDRLRIFAMLREDEFDIDMTTLEIFVPARIGVPLKLKSKTTKTP
jgi:hypothetical protein